MYFSKRIQNILSYFLGIFRCSRVSG